jgi:hypothetical protein
MSAFFKQKSMALDEIVWVKENDEESPKQRNKNQAYV